MISSGTTISTSSIVVLRLVRRYRMNHDLDKLDRRFEVSSWIGWTMISAGSIDGLRSVRRYRMDESPGRPADGLQHRGLAGVTVTFSDLTFDLNHMQVESGPVVMH